MLRTIRRHRDLAWSYLRYRRNIGTRGGHKPPSPIDIPKAQVVHLTERLDRAKHFREEFSRIGLDHVIFEATKRSDGVLGCALSHRRLVESTHPNEVTWVCEDDITFDASGTTLTETLRSFIAHPGLDVLVLSHKTPGPTLPISTDFALTTSSQTTASYLFKPSARKALIRSFDQSALMLGLGTPPEVAAIDIHWKQLQVSQLVFCVPRKALAHQVASYSDVQRREVDYYDNSRNLKKSHVDLGFRAGPHEGG